MKKQSSCSLCFQIVACGKKSSEDDDENEAVEEKKAPSTKRTWSFGKRSTRHRVLSNSLPSEPPPSSSDKERPENNAEGFAEQTHAAVSAKLPLPCKADDVFPLSPVGLSLKDADTNSVENVNAAESSSAESVVIIIQAAVRGYLAQRELDNLKNVIKLQAAVRGHLVRRQAVGTLRCVQAITRLQALVRGRHVRLSEKGVAIQQKLNEMRKMDSPRSNSLEKQDGGSEPNSVTTSADKVLGSTFVRQLLESTARTKPICMICDPMEPSSGWRWLERWMTLSARGSPRSWNRQLASEDHDSAEKHILVDNVVERSDGTAMDHRLEEKEHHSVTSLEGDEDLITIDTNGFALHSCPDTEVSGESTDRGIDEEVLEHAVEGSGFTSNSTENIRKALQSSLDSLSIQSQSISHNAVNDPIPDPSEEEFDTREHPLIGVTSTQQETDKKENLAVSKESSHPSFSAVRSKFEELSSVPAPGREITSNNFEAPAMVTSGPIFLANPDAEVIEISPENGLASSHQTFEMGTSEFSTEISISSSLDSPDRLEIGAGESECPNSTLNNRDFEANGTFQDELKCHDPISESLSPSNTKPCVPEEPNGRIATCADSTISMTNVEPSKGVESDFQIEFDTGKEHLIHDNPHEESPISHVTVPESYGTPSSQASSGAQKSKGIIHKSIRKRLSSSISKDSPSGQSHDSSERNIVDNLSKDSRSGRRRNSFESAKPDYAGEQRINSLPNYMQATESAKAKAFASHSPKSSPDPHDKDDYHKKRQSLSQKLPGGKVTTGQSPQAREWRR